MAQDSKSSNTRIAFFLNLGFTVLVLVGGLISGSIAIIPDSLHVNIVQDADTIRLSER